MYDLDINDLDIIAQLEKHFGKKLNRMEEIRWNSVGYQLNAQRQVVVLGLYECKLTVFPSEILQLRRLQKLEWWNNGLKQLPKEIDQLQQLRELSLVNNQLTQLPKKIGQLQQLQRLHLENNKLTQLPKEIGQLQRLQWLNLQNNQLTQLPKEIGQLQQLQELSLEDNKFTQLPKEIGQLQQLQWLNLQRNQIIKLPKALLELNLEIKWDNNSWEEGIHVEDNPLEIPPIEVVKQGKQAIIDYYNALTPNKIITTPVTKATEKNANLIPKPEKIVSKPRPLNELKLLLVGDGGAGKTSLMKRLLRRPFDRTEAQTHGINLNTLEMAIPATAQFAGATVKLHCWDFGGQEIMHATHQFFLTKRSLYILVLDARREAKTDYWLKHIQSFGENSPIIIVINKIDENPHFDLPRSQLMQKYPNIKHFCRFSCATDEGLSELCAALQQTIPHIELVQTLFPASWWQVKTALVEQAQTKNFTSYDHYIELCQSHEITKESEQITLINFLHELGIVTHFDQPWLRETNVINPKWLTEAVYKLVTTKLARNGKLTLTQLASLLDAKIYPRHKHDYLIGLMRRFELCYPLNAKTLLFPDLLLPHEPDLTLLNAILQQPNALHLVLNYEFLPKAVFTRFLVRIYQDIDTQYYWKLGALLRDGHSNSVALMRVDDTARRITLDLAGSQRKDYLAVLLFLLRDLHASFKLAVDERIGLPDNSTITVSYEHLLGLLQEGETEIRPEGAKKKYNIYELVGMAYHTKPTEAEIMAFLQKLVETQEIQDEKTFWQKFKESIELRIPFGIGSIDLNKLVKALFEK